MSEGTRRVTEALLEGYLVGSLDAETRARVEAVLAESEADRVRLEEMRAKSAALLVRDPAGPRVGRLESSQRTGRGKPLVLVAAWVVVVAVVTVGGLVLAEALNEVEASSEQGLAKANAAEATARQERTQTTGRDPDKDGIENDQDACPNQPGPEELKGCPEEDSDKDGVPNRVDTCAHESGLEPNLGCPEAVLPLVELGPRMIELRGKVYFKPAQALILERSFVLLDWVVKVMREHPEISRVEVGAHTDGRGFADEERQLTQQRAEAVRSYLIAKGVAAGRLTARGYGSDRPIDCDTTARCRENNRRVEFRILRDQETSAKAP